MTETVLAALLAAGASRRLGQPKQLLRIGEQTLLAHNAAQLHEATGEAPLVVLGYRSNDMLAALGDVDFMVAHNADWASGMASSIAVAARAVPASVSGLLIAVCDMPRIGVAHYRTLIDRHRAAPNAVVAAGYPHGPGVPAVFPTGWRERLLQLSGDQGARTLLTDNATEIAVDLGEAALDIDTPDDLRGLTRTIEH
ncbi:MAG: nucleotidyltransferase family protein [Pseudomonadota bacterium]